MPRKPWPSTGRAKRSRWTPTDYEILHDAAVSSPFCVAAANRPTPSKAGYHIFCQAPGHRGLHFKRVHDDPVIYSARVGIGYRAVGAFDGDTIAWFWIGSHGDYDRLLENL